MTINNNPAIVIIKGDGSSGKVMRSQGGRRHLTDYFGIIPERLGEVMLEDLARIRKKQIELTRRRTA